LKILLNNKKQYDFSWKGTWCGDVWKSIFYLRKKNTQMNWNTDMGLG